MTPATTSDRKPLRADAQRKYDALLAAGKAVFAQSGVDAPLEEVARLAGTGQGTLYRHFPTREHLLAAILEDRLDLLEARARELRDAADPWVAMSDWLHLFATIAVDYRGMSARLGATLADPGSPVAVACEPMKAAFRRLFERAQVSAAARTDISADQVLALVASLPAQPAGDASDTLLHVILEGLHRQDAPSKKARSATKGAYR